MPVQDGEITLQLIILVVIYIECFRNEHTAPVLRCSPNGAWADFLKFLSTPQKSGLSPLILTFPSNSFRRKCKRPLFVCLFFYTQCKCNIRTLDTEMWSQIQETGVVDWKSQYLPFCWSVFSTHFRRLCELWLAELSGSSSFNSNMFEGWNYFT